MRVRALVPLIVLLCLLASGRAESQDRLLGLPGEQTDLFDRRWDFILVERGKIILGYGDGKLFGFDVRQAMGNPAALSSTTQIKWNQKISELNHTVLMVAVRYPPELYTQGAALGERQFQRDVSGLFNGFREEEYIDLFAWLIRSGYMAGSSEEDAMRTFRTVGYVGGAAAVINMLVTNQVNIPVTFRLYKGEYRNKPYHVRMKVQVNRFGFGANDGVLFDKTRVRTRFTLRRPQFADLNIDIRGNRIGRAHPSLWSQQITYDLKRLGTYYVGANQPWDEFNQTRGFDWYLGAAIDVISPSKYEDSRVRTGFQINFDGSARVPERYFIEFYERYRLRDGKRDIVLQGRGDLIVDGIQYEGIGGEIKANFLLGSTAPRASRTYSPQDWDRFSRVYLTARINALVSDTDEYAIFVAYAAPFDIDIAFEKGFEWWLRRRRLPLMPAP